MNRYEKGKIYKIVDAGFNKSYIGSTCETLSRRIERHRMAYRKYLNGKRMETKCHLLFDEFGVENCRIFLIENFPCNSKEELLKQEGFHILQNECVNKNVAGRTNEEYYDHKKEQIKEKNRVYYHNNIEERKAKQKEYRDEHKEELKEKKQKHRDDNLEEYKRRGQEKYQKNRDKILERVGQVCVCQCGSSYTYGHKVRHEKSKKHQKYVEQQEQEME